MGAYEDLSVFSSYFFVHLWDESFVCVVVSLLCKEGEVCDEYPEVIEAW